MICAGSGGVGKTTTSAAIAMGLAARGARVAVVTIDPARRLADALGLDELGNDPALVDPSRFAAGGVELTGELWAMTLDPKRTFDELIERLAPDDETRDEILDNRIYQQLSGAVAGSQEFTAVAKLYDLHNSGRFDVLVLDTPPSRNALDFLDAPDRLTGFFDGRALKLFLAPTGLAARAMGRGTGVVFGVLSRLTGVDLLDDLSVFFRALGGLLDGFRERAEGVKALLTDPRDDVPRRHLTGARAGRGGDLLPPQAARVADAVRRPDREPRARARRRQGQAPVARGGRRGARRGARLGAGREGRRAPTARRSRSPSATPRRSSGCARRPATRTRVIVPELDGDVHDVAGLVAIHAHLFVR